jgi:hypothetical protein
MNPGIYASPCSSDSIVGIEADPETSFFELHWILTRRCSLACSYCPPHRHNPAAPQTDGPTLLRGLESICYLLRAQRVRINLTGGEPTVHPSFLSFVELAIQSDAIHHVRVVTNLLSSDRLYTALAKLDGGKGRIQIVASFHPKQTDLAAFERRVRFLAAAGVQIAVKLMIDCSPPSDELLKVVGELSTRYRCVRLLAQPIRGSGAKLDPDLVATAAGLLLNLSPTDARSVIRLTNTGLQIARCSDVAMLIDYSHNHFQGWICDAGFKALFIDSDGRVFSAMCKPDPDPLFNLFRDRLPIWAPARSILCPHEICECPSTVRIPKRHASIVGR